jgi:hypothetical protein
MKHDGPDYGVDLSWVLRDAVRIWLARSAFHFRSWLWFHGYFAVCIQDQIILKPRNPFADVVIEVTVSI